MSEARNILERFNGYPPEGEAVAAYDNHDYECAIDDIETHIKEREKEVLDEVEVDKEQVKEILTDLLDDDKEYIPTLVELLTEKTIIIRRTNNGI